MNSAYLVGHITVKNTKAWAEYGSKVPGTLVPWGGELLFRGKRAAVLAGAGKHTDIVVIRFPNMPALDSWFSSAAYQALIPIRTQAAEVDLFSYEA